MSPLKAAESRGEYKPPYPPSQGGSSRVPLRRGNEGVCSRSRLLLLLGSALALAACGPGGDSPQGHPDKKDGGPGIPDGGTPGDGGTPDGGDTDGGPLPYPFPCREDDPEYLAVRKILKGHGGTVTVPPHPDFPEREGDRVEIPEGAFDEDACVRLGPARFEGTLPGGSRYLTLRGLDVNAEAAGYPLENGRPRKLGPKYPVLVFLHRIRARLFGIHDAEETPEELPAEFRPDGTTVRTPGLSAFLPGDSDPSFPDGSVAAAVNRDVVTVTAGAEDEGRNSLAMLVLSAMDGNGNPLTLTGQTETEMTFKTTLSPGHHTIRVRVQDTQGNIAEKEIDVTVDLCGNVTCPIGQVCSLETGQCVDDGNPCTPDPCNGHAVSCEPVTGACACDADHEGSVCDRGKPPLTPILGPGQDHVTVGPNDTGFSVDMAVDARTTKVFARKGAELLQTFMVIPGQSNPLTVGFDEDLGAAGVYTFTSVTVVDGNEVESPAATVIVDVDSIGPDAPVMDSPTLTIPASAAQASVGMTVPRDTHAMNVYKLVGGNPVLIPASSGRIGLPAGTGPAHVDLDLVKNPADPNMADLGGSYIFKGVDKFGNEGVGAQENVDAVPAPVMGDIQIDNSATPGVILSNFNYPVSVNVQNAQTFRVIIEKIWPPVPEAIPGSANPASGQIGSDGKINIRYITGNAGGIQVRMTVEVTGDGGTQRVVREFTLD